MSTLQPVEELRPAPNFALEDQNGRIFRLSDYRGRNPVVLVFNRGFR